MIQALNEGTSLHALTTMELFGLPNLKEAKKDPEKYSTGKVFNFTVGYGGGIMKLMALLHQAGIFTLNEADVKNLRDRWFALYSRVKPWQMESLEFVKTHGYTVTPLGRRIYFRDPESVYNEAFNRPIQSMCYEGLQQAGVLMLDEIHELERTVLPERGMIRMVNEAHDEYLVEAKKRLNPDSVKDLITRNMINGIQPMFEARLANGRNYNRVIVRVEAQCVNSWAEKP
jgi:DNA polymerase-1